MIPIILITFALRLAYGLCGKFWSQDETQIYLIGLKYATTGQWPYYGPDLVYSKTQLSGALQGLLVGLPLKIASFPESPFVFLNLLTFSALGFLYWYCRQRFPRVPLWILWSWIFFVPWTINFGTHVINPSYVLPAAILFWIGFLESNQIFTIGSLRPSIAFLLMGFALAWIYQVHMSWVLLLPAIGFNALCSLRQNSIESTVKYTAATLAGMFIPSLLLFPTLMQYGIHHGVGSTSANVIVNVKNLRYPLHIFARFLSFVSFGDVGSIGRNMHDRLQFVRRFSWAAPFIFFSVVAGVLQCLYLAIAPFLGSTRMQKNTSMLIFSVLTVTYISFLFSIKGPSTHTFYLLFPLAIFYLFSCFEPLLARKKVRLLAAVMIMCGVIAEVPIALDHFDTTSLYRDRPRVVEALQKNDYTILGLRRDDAGYQWEQSDAANAQD